MLADELVRRRMVAQRLWGPRPRRPEEAVRALLGVQAQDHRPARWAVGQRTEGATDDSVRRAIADGRIVRTHVLRPTWHLVHRDDARWLLALTAPRILARMASRHRQLGLDGGVRRRALRAIERAVAAGPRTREELGEALAAAGVDPDGQRLPHLLMVAELERVIASGPPRDEAHTYAAFDERVPPAAPLEPDEALARLARRFLAGHGPATAGDLARWASLTLREARRAVELGAEGLERAELDGRVYLFDPSVDADPPPSPAVELVHVFDEAIVGYGESPDLLTGPESARLLTQPDAFVRVLLVDGRMAGRWREVRPPRGKGAAGPVEVRVDPSRPLGRAGGRALRAALERYAAFLGRPVVLASG